MGIQTLKEQPVERKLQPHKQFSLNRTETLHQAHLFELNASEFFLKDKSRYKEIETLIAPTAISMFGTMESLKNFIHQFPPIEEVFGYDFPTLFQTLRKEGFSDGDIKQVMIGASCDRLIDIALLKNQGITFNSENDFASQTSTTKLKRVVKEVEEKGFLFLDYFYGKYTPLKLEVDRNNDIEELQAIWKVCKDKFKSKKEDVFILEKINIDIISRTRQLNQERQGMGFKKEKLKTPEEKREEYLEALDDAFDYARYCFSEEGLEKSAVTVEKMIKIIAEGRDRANKLTKYFAASYDLSRRFWPIFAGRDRKITDLEALGITEETFKKYLEKVFDKKIRTEAAAFWFERKTDQLPRFFLSPNYGLVYSIKSILESHLKSYPLAKKNGQEIKLMILINDEQSVKLNVKATATLQEIIALLQRTQTENKINYHKFNDEQKYELKHESYRFGKHSQAYDDFYLHNEEKPVKLLGIKTPWNQTIQAKGDYIVRLTTKRSGYASKKTSPFSLFSVDSHKALVDIDLTNKSQKVGLAIKFSHRHFDGRPARSFFKNFFEKLKDYNDPQFDPLQTKPLVGLLVEKEDSSLKEPRSPTSKLPIFEADAVQEPTDKYQSTKSLTPNIIRAAVLSLANGVTDAHVLFANDDNPHWEGPYDNIQPAIISLRPILRIYNEFKTTHRLTSDQKIAVKKYFAQVNKMIKNTKNNLGPAAVFSAPTGRLQEPIYKASRQLHKGAVLLKETPSMFSPLPDMENGKFVVRSEFEDTIFFTAQASAYTQRAKLSEAIPGLGVIGYSHSRRQKKGNDIEDQVFYTVRKSPIQALYAFKQYIDKIIKPENPEKVYSAFERLIENWEKLIIGEISLDKYREFLKKAFKSLNIAERKRMSIPTEEGLYENLQTTLNTILTTDAQNTITGIKINQEKEMLYEFLQKSSV